MTVYQAIRQYSPLVNDQSETDTDTETPIGKINKLLIYINILIFCTYRKCKYLDTTAHNIL